MDSICRKNWPTYTALKWNVFMRSHSWRRPTIFSMTGTLICCRFIDKYHLIWSVWCQLACPGMTEFRVSLCSALLYLKVRKSRQKRVVMIPSSWTIWHISTCVAQSGHWHRHRRYPIDSKPAHRCTKKDVEKGNREETRLVNVFSHNDVVGMYLLHLLGNFLWAPLVDCLWRP